jgi:hypothetical protein
MVRIPPVAAELLSLRRMNKTPLMLSEACKDFRISKKIIQIMSETGNNLPLTAVD